VGEVVTTNDAGANWLFPTFDVSPGLFAYFSGFAFDASNPRRVFAGEGGSGSGTLYVSGDGGAAWKTAVAGSGGGIAVDHLNPRRMYTTNFRTADYGTSWLPMAAGNLSSVAVGAGGVLYAGTSHGILRSDDFGGTFHDVGAGTGDLYVLRLAADPYSPTVLAGPWSVTSAPGSPHLVESRDGGATWDPADSGLPPVDVAAVAIDPGSGTEYAASDGGLYRRIGTPTGCRSGANALCLGAGRFRVQAVWTT
jgi:hypothetical protein